MRAKHRRRIQGCADLSFLCAYVLMFYVFAYQYVFRSICFVSLRPSSFFRFNAKDPMCTRRSSCLDKLLQCVTSQPERLFVYHWASSFSCHMCCLTTRLCFFRSVCSHGFHFIGASSVWAARSSMAGATCILHDVGIVFLVWPLGKPYIRRSLLALM